ncbi:hypothetical protein MMC27_004475 [Xylographa pallens]|nr:hypothetical protein [Xylographa pallens]
MRSSLRLPLLLALLALVSTDTIAAAPTTARPALLPRPSPAPTTLATVTHPHWEPIKPFQWHGPVRETRTTAAVTTARPAETPLRWDPIRPFMWHGPVRVESGEVGRRGPGEGVRGKPVPGMPGHGELGWGW